MLLVLDLVDVHPPDQIRDTPLVEDSVEEEAANPVGVDFVSTEPAWLGRPRKVAMRCTYFGSSSGWACAYTATCITDRCSM